MDIVDAWRTLRTNPADAPRAGAHLVAESVHRSSDPYFCSK
jgi:hypothetical protein